MTNSIGDAIRFFRQRAGLKQEALAVRLGTDANTISRFERGQKRPSIERLLAIAEALEVPCSDFFLFMEQAGGTAELPAGYDVDALHLAIRQLEHREREVLGGLVSVLLDRRR